MLEHQVPKNANRTLYVEITITQKRKNGESVHTYRAELSAEYISFAMLNRFLKDLEEINNQIRLAAEEDNFLKMEIVRYDYDPGEEIKDGRMINYDRWEYSGYPQNDWCDVTNDERGIYLLPDKEYTEEHHDMFYDFTLESITA